MKAEIETILNRLKELSDTGEYKGEFEDDVIRLTEIFKTLTATPE